jgi:uncharacterized protein YjbJ (UPF0337 family)
MDKDRIAGTAEEVKGSVREAAGKVVGNAKLVNEGKTEKVAGKIQNTVGRVKDALKK